jgi:predicted transcriptional regulator YheO
MDKVDFKGPSFRDFDKQDKTEEEKQIANPSQSVTKRNSDAVSNINRSARSPKNLLATNRKAITDYLNNALADQEVVVIKLCDIADSLGINMNTLYRHLKIIRDTDFVIKKVFNGTEIRRR